MTAREYKKARLVITILLAVLLSNILFAQNLSGNSREFGNSGFTESAIKSLEMGIQSDNAGLKRSAIYLAGIYEIDAVVGVLIKQLKKESDPNTRVLIALALYRIGNEEGLDAIEELVKNDDNLRVRKMSYAILNQFKIDVHKTNSLSTLAK
jgi:hypothetical protein